MRRLPLLNEYRAPLLVRAGIYLLVPVVLLLLLPLLLLIVIVLYLAALFHGLRIFVTVVAGKKEMPGFELQKPHFLEIEAPVKQLSDESTKSAKG